MDLIFVWIGDKLPDWALISIDFAIKNSNSNVYLLITNKSSKISSKCIQIEISSFYTNTQESIISNDKHFRDGFWIKTTERFFILRDFVKRYNIYSFFHAELDNLVFDISHLGICLDKIGKGIFIPKDSKERCIASFLYINNFQILEEFCNYILNNPEQLSNDMLLLGDFGSKNTKVFYLPNESAFNDLNSINYLDHNKIGGIFDAAAIGQYLFGIDPRNTYFPVFNKFLNENLKYDLSKCTFNISISENIAYINGIKIYNLHIHSKIFAKLLNHKWLLRLLKRINNNKKSYITHRINEYFKISN